MFANFANLCQNRKNKYPQNVAILAIRKNKYPQNFCNKRRIFDDESFFILLFYYQDICVVVMKC